jgi:arginine exporter protein ArgO
MVFWEAFFFGFVQAFAIGPISLYGIREGLNPSKGTLMQLQVIFGASMVKLFYLTLAVNGVTSLMKLEWVQTMLWVTAAIMLIKMGAHTLKDPLGEKGFQNLHQPHLKYLDNDFFKGFFMCLVSPMVLIYTFIVVGGMYSSYAQEAGPMQFALSVSLGGIVTMLLITLATFAVRQIFHQWMLVKMVQVSSFILLGYGVSFAWKALLSLEPMVMAMIGT